jgi:cytochrome oxidase Cu insertion factor (SCO1/SenC/PrrC family)
VLTADGAKKLGITTITFNPDADLRHHLKEYDYNVDHWSQIPKLPIFHRL